jgi:YD repeat-containing protein
MSITQNKEGLVTSIIGEDGEKAVFEYFFAETKADATKDRAKITVTDDEGDVTELNLQLNSNGYVEYCNSIDHAGTSDASEFTWEMKYDADGHLIEMRRSEGSGELTKITYKDGDAVKTSTSYMGGGDMNGDGVLDGNDEREDGAIIDYTTGEIATPIDNKGCLMMFDELLDVDMDEMIYAYYGGMLGKATKHLPLAMRDADDTSVELSNYKWTLNSDGYPTQLLIIDWGNEEKYTFTW